MATTVVVPNEQQLSNPTNPPAAPQGKVYTETEVLARIQQVREEEKNKLYGDVNHHKTEAQRLQSELANAKTQLNELQKKANPEGLQNTELQAKISDLQTQLDKSRLDSETAIHSAIDRTAELLREQFQKQRVADLVQTKKEALIEAADGKIIPEMVTGNTVEEIQASVLKAKERFQQIAEAAKAEAIKGALPGPVSPGSTPINSQENNTPDGKSYRSLSEAEWQQQKQDIKKDVYARHGLPMKQ
jgi:DNA repair exonuclease SbcCD ATPase subunit